MTFYKGIRIEPVLVDLIRHMKGVEDYREVLGRLQAGWDTLTLLGQLTGTAAEMSGTRQAFEELTGNLLNHLGLETLKKSINDLAAKAQNAIDILVRNLFERTADIGFLALDDDVAAFLLEPAGRDSAMRARFREYVAKYSVYSDVVLFNAEGTIVARLADDGSSGRTFRHALIDEALTSDDAYVEFYGSADFLSGGDHLVYAYRVCDPQGVRIGVLALVFRLADEMAGIFENLLSTEDWTVLACVTAEGEVIASSSPVQVPIGSQLPASAMNAKGELVRFAGRHYLGMGCTTQGYQGYMGPGWLGVAMIPIEFAFDRNKTNALVDVSQDVLDSVAHHSSLFSPALRAIPERAEQIQRDLNRSVWNGSVRQAESGDQSGAFSKTLLWEISNAGRKTQAVFEQSIGNLHETVVAALLENALSRASFAIDVMDRNLYERANDCRWWALNSTFRRVLAGRTISSEDAATCGRILSQINSLYTVYENLVLFDEAGRIVAVSNTSQTGLIGMPLESSWVHQTLQLRSSQHYAVSHFEASPLYHNRPTFVYCAAVQHPNTGRPVGGIAIVFDSTPQFAAMLSDGLPRNADGMPIEGAFTLFVDRAGKIISTSDDRFSIGTTVESGLEPSQVAKGKTRTCIVALNGVYYGVGTAMSAGYREYKINDGYNYDIATICAVPLAEIATIRPVRSHDQAGSAKARKAERGEEAMEIATFHVGPHWIGVPAHEVIESIDGSGLTPPTANKTGLVAGFKLYQSHLLTIFDLAAMLGLPPSQIPPRRQIVIIKLEDESRIGILVDSLGEIPEVPTADIQPVPEGFAASRNLMLGIVSNITGANGKQRTLSILDRTMVAGGASSAQPQRRADILRVRRR